MRILLRKRQIKQMTVWEWWGFAETVESEPCAKFDSSFQIQKPLYLSFLQPNSDKQ